MTRNGKLDVSDQDKDYIESIITKVDKARENNDAISHIKLNDLRKLLTLEEAKIIDRILAIDPTTYGFKGPYLGVEPVPAGLMRIEKQPYYFKNEKKFTDVQYVSAPTYQAYREMVAAMESDLGRPLLIESSYRSKAFQAAMFLSILKIYNFNVPRTIKRAAIPGYSEHCTLGKPSIFWPWISRILTAYPARKHRKISRIHGNISGWPLMQININSLCHIQKIIHMVLCMRLGIGGIYRL